MARADHFYVMLCVHHPPTPSSRLPRRAVGGGGTLRFLGFRGNPVLPDRSVFPKRTNLREDVTHLVPVHLWQRDLGAVMFPCLADAGERSLTESLA